MILERRQKERTEVPITPIAPPNKPETLGLRASWGCVSSTQNIQSQPAPGTSRHLPWASGTQNHPPHPDLLTFLMWPLVSGPKALGDWSCCLIHQRCFCLEGKM